MVLRQKLKFRICNVEMCQKQALKYRFEVWKYARLIRESGDKIFEGLVIFWGVTVFRNCFALQSSSFFYLVSLLWNLNSQSLAFAVSSCVASPEFLIC